MQSCQTCEYYKPEERLCDGGDIIYDVSPEFVCDSYTPDCGRLLELCEDLEAQRDELLAVCQPDTTRLDLPLRDRDAQDVLAEITAILRANGFYSLANWLKDKVLAERAALAKVRGEQI